MKFFNVSIPNTKGKVENSVNYVKQNFFAGKIFSSLVELKQQAREWLDQANQRIHGTTKEKSFDRLQRETLIRLENKKLYDTNIVQYRRVLGLLRNKLIFQKISLFRNSPKVKFDLRAAKLILNHRLGNISI